MFEKPSQEKAEAAAKFNVEKKRVIESCLDTMSRIVGHFPRSVYFVFSGSRTNIFECGKAEQRMEVDLNDDVDGCDG